MLKSLNLEAKNANNYKCKNFLMIRDSSFVDLHFCINNSPNEIKKVIETAEINKLTKVVKESENRYAFIHSYPEQVVEYCGRHPSLNIYDIVTQLTINISD